MQILTEELKDRNTSKEADRVEVVYYTDPLCCWSWALEPQLKELKARKGEALDWRYCMGGLIPDWNSYHDPVNSISRPTQMGPLWMEVKYKFGVTLNDRIWFTDPPASSYPACIAVKTAGLQSAAAAEEYLSLLRKASMEDARNIARKAILFEEAEKITVPFDQELFRKDLEADKGVALFRRDLEEIRVLGVQRFPTILMQKQGKPGIIMTGFRPVEVLEEALEKLLEG